MRARQDGFTLIELVVGITMMASVLVMANTLLVPQARQSAETIVQLRAESLAKGLMSEILGKRYDENSGITSPFLECGTTTPQKVCSSTLGPESGELRVSYDDVDDYHGLSLIQSNWGGTLSGFGGYSLSVNVAYDGNYDGTNDTNTAAKVITVVVTPSLTGRPQSYSVYRSNY